MVVASEKRYGQHTFTNELLQLKEWLKGKEITHVTMEIIGIYWKPVYNIREEAFEVVLVNARHIKLFLGGRQMCATVNGCASF